METQKLVKQLIIAKNDNTVMLAVLDFFKPLIESYARKLFFLEKEDAQQEIIIAIIEAIYSITKYENDAKCITYIHNAVKFKFSYLCKKNFKSPPIDETSETELYVRPYFEKYSDIEMFYDMEKRKRQLPEKQQLIFDYLLKGYSDKEISDILGLSRQYINRVKKTFI